MKTHVALLGVLLAAGTTFADPYTIAKQRARQTSEQNNAEQARIQKAAADPVQTDPALQATLQNINGLQVNFSECIKAEGAPDATQKASMLNNLSQAAQGTKPSAALVKKLANDLVPALAQRKKITVAQQKKLATAIHALFNSSHLSATQQKTMLDDVQKTLIDAGVSVDDAVNVVTDLKQIAEATK